MLEKLLGAQIISINESTIKVKLNDEIHILEIETDQGDCCGYADFKTNLLYSEDDTRNPIITNVELKQKEDSYESDSSVITFYGENNELATIESDAGSGSGWGYGACVTLRCKSLDLDQELASW